MALPDKPKFSLIKLLITAKTCVENVSKSDDCVRDPVPNAPEYTNKFLLGCPFTLCTHTLLTKWPLVSL